MDYSKLSDMQINAAVAICIWDTDMTAKSGEFDPCNNPADAWKIILANEISINYCQDEGEWLAHADGLMKEGCWCWDVEPSPFFLDIKPLRAAMIVFLMMQGD